MIYFPLAILNIVVSILCYITNPIVVFFADEVGELHGFLKNWQTWDDSLDVRFMVVEKVPSIFRYDFDSKYISSREPLSDPKYGRDKGCVILKPNAVFSIKEKIQRYFCRLLWLYRNNAYGFAFYFFGRKSAQSVPYPFQHFFVVENCKRSRVLIKTQKIIFMNVWPMN